MEPLIGVSVSTFAYGDGERRDGFITCDWPQCGEQWGVHGHGNFEAQLRKDGWWLDKGKLQPDGRHLCPDHAEFAHA